MTEKPRSKKQKQDKTRDQTDPRRVTLWTLVDRGDGRPRFERVTPW